MGRQPFHHLEQAVVGPQGEDPRGHHFPKTHLVRQKVLCVPRLPAQVFVALMAITVEQTHDVRVGQDAHDLGGDPLPDIKPVDFVGPHLVQGRVQGVLQVAKQGRAHHD